MREIWGIGKMGEAKSISPETKCGNLLSLSVILGLEPRIHLQGANIAFRVKSKANNIHKLPLIMVKNKLARIRIKRVPLGIRLFN